MNTLTFLVGILLSIIPTSAFGVWAMGDAKRAKYLFMASACVAEVWIITWVLNNQNWRLSTRALIGAAATLIPLIFLATAIKYVNSRSIEPNIVPLDFDTDTDKDVKLSERGVFYITEDWDNWWSAVVIKFQNRSKPPTSIMEVDNVRAEISFYDLDFPDKELTDHRIHRACWLNEPTHRVTFPIDEPRYVICGIFEPMDNEASGFKNKFTTYEHPLDPSKPLDRREWQNWKGFLIKIKLLIGKSGEFGGEFDCELRIQRSEMLNGKSQGVSYSFEYLSDKKKKERHEENIRTLNHLIRQGDPYLARYEGRYDEKLWMKIHKWNDDTEEFVRRRFGLRASCDFGSSPPGRKIFYEPDLVNKDDHSFVNNFYTRLCNLKDLLHRLEEKQNPLSIKEKVLLTKQKLLERFVKKGA